MDFSLYLNMKSLFFSLSLTLALAWKDNPITCTFQATAEAGNPTFKLLLDLW